MSYLGQYLGKHVGNWWGATSEERVVPGAYYGYVRTKKTKKELDEVQTKIADMMPEFSENKNSDIYEKAAYRELKSFKYDFIAPIISEVIPQDRDYVTYEQMLILRQLLTQEYLRHKILLDEEDLILALYCN